MTQQVHVLIEARGDGVVATVTIDNQTRLNSMNSDLMLELRDTLAVLAADEDLRACILTGAGEKAFIGGADIKEMAQIQHPNEARIFISGVHACCHAMRAIPVPTIARINGFCFGAGLELAAACDLRIATEAAEFGMPEVKLGIPSVVEAALLPMLVGWGRTRQILLLGQTFNAVTALAWGLVESAVPETDLDETVGRYLGEVLTGKPRALRLQKQLIRSWEDLPLRAAVQAGIDSFATAFETSEPSCAMHDFLRDQAQRKAALVATS